MTWTALQWRRFWFAPTSALNLGIARSAFFALLLLIYWSRDSSGWATVPEVLWTPIPLFRALQLHAGSEQVLRALDLVWKASLLLGAVGLLTRVSTTVAFGLGVYLLGLPHNFGKIHHSSAIVVLVLGILALSRSGDAWSLDRLILRSRLAPRGDRGSSEPVGAEYTWPIRLIWVTMAMALFSAGLSKMRASGLAWILSDNMAAILISHQYTHRPLADWGLLVAGFPWLARMAAGGSVIMELSAPVALMSRRARAIVIPALLSMQLGIWIVLGVSFASFMTVYVFWVPWDRVAALLGRLSRGRVPVPSTASSSP